MPDNIIRLVLSNFPLSMCILAFFLALFNQHRFNQVLLSLFLFLVVGLSGIWGFVMHAFFSQIASHNIGFAANPFEFEVACANLAIGICGLIACFSTYSFKVATTLMTSIFLWGAATGHLYQAYFNHNYQPGNIGSILWTDIGIPIILIVLLILNRPKLPDGVFYY